jgi:hypothetical protein
MVTLASLQWLLQPEDCLSLSCYLLLLVVLVLLVSVSPLKTVLDL